MATGAPHRWAVGAPREGRATSSRCRMPPLTFSDHGARGYIRFWVRAIRAMHIRHWRPVRIPRHDAEIRR